VDSGESTLFASPEPPIDLSGYEVKQIFFESKDGTTVPMFIVHKSGIDLDGQNPTLLYGYGGFGSSLTPSYHTTLTVWLEMGGVLAMANLRGGGEYGREWHLAGTKLQKQNVFDDFIAAAEWLIANGYTSTPKLAIQGARAAATAASWWAPSSPSGRISSGPLCRRWVCSTCCATTFRAPTPDSGPPISA
jgi:prolyl oligopeptidase